MVKDVDHNAVFRTYHNYLKAIERYLWMTYGHEEEQFDGLAQAFAQLPASSRISRVSSINGGVAKSMRQAWATEVFIHHQSETAASADVIACANLWATVQSYYATFHAAQAVIQSSGWWSRPPNSHSGTLKLLSEVTTKRRVFPAPFDAFCVGAIDSCTFGGSISGKNPMATNSLVSPSDQDCAERIALILKTTRERQIDEAKQIWLASGENRKPKGGRYVRMPGRVHEQICQRIPATTLFNFLYRFRIRSNYRDAEAFLLGGSDQKEGIDFNEALICNLQATLLVLELVLARIIGARQFVSIAEGFIASVGDPAERTVGARLAHVVSS